MKQDRHNRLLDRKITGSAYLISTPNSNLADQYIGKLVANLIPDAKTNAYHPDILKINATDKSIGIDLVKELKDKLSLRPYQADYKIAIINQAQKLTTEAQNALLKTLEEPTLSSVIILASTNYQLLLPTIISRCQLIFLGNKQSLNNNSDFNTDILKLDLVQKFMLAEEVASDAQNWLSNLTIVWRKIFLSKLGAGESDNLRQKTDAKQLSLASICQFLKNIQRTYDLISQNVNGRLAIEVLLLNAPKLNPS